MIKSSIKNKLKIRNKLQVISAEPSMDNDVSITSGSNEITMGNYDL